MRKLRTERCDFTKKIASTMFDKKNDRKRRVNKHRKTYGVGYCKSAKPSIVSQT